jgi:hypothetical protein
VNLFPKNWWKSKTIWTSGAAFIVGIGTAAGFIDTEMGLKIEGCLVPLILTFLKMNNTELG